MKHVKVINEFQNVEKTYTKKEVIDLIKKFSDHAFDSIDHDGIDNSTSPINLIDFEEDKWIKKNLK